MGEVGGEQEVAEEGEEGADAIGWGSVHSEETRAKWSRMAAMIRALV